MMSARPIPNNNFRWLEDSTTSSDELGKSDVKAEEALNLNGLNTCFS